MLVFTVHKHTTLMHLPSCVSAPLSCREWAAAVREADPDFFNRLVNQQQPEYLWIGCSDSRVPVRDTVLQLVVMERQAG
jgi:hypothetical protein